MKKTACKICGSTEIQIDGDTISCLSCGNKYTLPQKKSDKVHRVKIDKTDHAQNFLLRAQQFYADNNMYEIMNRFSRGEITDKQAINALSASHLGKQYVLKTEKACKSAVIVNRLYLCKSEREDIEKDRKEKSIMSLDNAKVSIEKYRRIGKYIEEILK